MEMTFTGRTSGMTITATCRPLDNHELEQVHALDQEVYTTLDNKENYVPMRDWEMEYFRLIGAKFFGVFCKNQLIAYYVFWHHDSGVEIPAHLQQELDTAGMYNLAADLPFIPKEEYKSTIEVHRALFHAEYWDYGINQFFLPKVFGKMREMGYKHLTATISPENCASFVSAMKSGLTIGNLKVKYGDKTRYIMYSNLTQPDTYQNQPVAVDHLDIPRQQQLLAEGYRGKATQKEMPANASKPIVKVIYDLIQPK